MKNIITFASILALTGCLSSQDWKELGDAYEASGGVQTGYGNTPYDGPRETPTHRPTPRPKTDDEAKCPDGMHHECGSPRLPCVPNETGGSTAGQAC